MTQPDEMKRSESSEKSEEQSRRDFLHRTLAAAAGMAVAGSAASALEPEPQAAATVAFQPVGEIESHGTTLQGVLTIVNGPKNLPGFTGGQPPMMRYFRGYDLTQPSKVWPPDSQKTTPYPGPTLRAKVGDTVQITFLNQVKVDEFGNTMDRAERGEETGCDVSTAIIAAARR